MKLNETAKMALIKMFDAAISDVKAHHPDDEQFTQWYNAYEKREMCVPPGESATTGHEFWGYLVAVTAEKIMYSEFFKLHFGYGGKLFQNFGGELGFWITLDTRDFFNALGVKSAEDIADKELVAEIQETLVAEWTKNAKFYLDGKNRLLPKKTDLSL